MGQPIASAAVPLEVQGTGRTHQRPAKPCPALAAKAVATLAGAEALVVLQLLASVLEVERLRRPVARAPTVAKAGPTASRLEVLVLPAATATDHEEARPDPATVPLIPVSKGSGPVVPTVTTPAAALLTAGRTLTRGCREQLDGSPVLPVVVPAERPTPAVLPASPRAVVQTVKLLEGACPLRLAGLVTPLSP